MAQTTKLPPQNIDAEQSLLGSLLIDKDSIVRIAELLSPASFYRTEQHGEIFAAIRNLFDKREPIDLVTLTEELKRLGTYDKVGGSAYLTTLINTVPTSAHIEYYAKIIKDHSVRRNLISQATRLVERAYEEEIPIEDLLESAESTIFALSQERIKRDFIAIKDALAEAFDRLDELQKSSGKLRGVATGFRDLDSKLAGFQNSNLIILAARPSIGKSSFALNIAQHVAVHLGLPVGIFSLEMSVEELIDRLLVAQADIDNWKLKTGKLDEKTHDLEKISQAMGELAEAPLFIDDTPGISISEIRTKARRMQIEHGLKLLIVDYLQLIRGRNTENRVQEVSEISQGLKNIAREMKIPVLALSQLNRSVEARGTRKPQLADLRESGCLAGDTLLMLADSGRLVKIKDLVGRKDIPIFSLNKDLKLEIKNISTVFSSGKKNLFEIKTRSGKLIKASANHKFLTIDGWKRLDNLGIGTKLATPRIFPITPMESILTGDQLVLLAHLIGDGCVLPRQPIHYTSADKFNLQIVGEISNKLFDIKSRLVKQGNWYHLYLPSPYRLARGRHHPIINWFSQMGLRPVRSYEKELPDSLFGSTVDKIALFLQHLWATDGNLSLKKMLNRKDAAAIYYSTSSFKLATQVQHLLLRLGILSSLRSVPQKSGRLNYHVSVQGSQMQLRFCEKVGSYGVRGEITELLMKNLKNIQSNPNVDIIPKEVWYSVIKPVKAEANLGWRELSQMIQVSYCGTTLFKSGLSRERMKKVASALNNSQLNSLATSDIFWDEIISIQELGIEEVFDATVPNTHNFIANDFIVHNSIEQDADVVMFLYRDDPENHPEQIKLDIQKHRNGPTGEIDLKFKADRTRFFGVEMFRNKPAEKPVEKDK